MKPDIHRLLDLQKLLDAYGQVERMVYIKRRGKFRKENDVEHSYNLAMVAWYLARYFPELDVNKIIQYALAHDIVEVYAGDTFTYGPKEKLDSKEQREAKAATRLKLEWSDFGEMNELIEAYEQKADAESKFVYALDKIMPILTIYINEGYSWKKTGVTVEMLYANKVAKVALSPEVQPYFEELNTLLLAHPEIIKPVKSESTY